MSTDLLVALRKKSRENAMKAFQEHQKKMKTGEEAPETTKTNGTHETNTVIDNYFNMESLNDYEIRMLSEFKTPDFEVFDQAYISDYGLLEILKKDVFLESDPIVHHAQILYILARRHGFIPFGFVNEDPSSSSKRKKMSVVYVGKAKGKKKASLFARK